MCLSTYDVSFPFLLISVNRRKQRGRRLGVRYLLGVSIELQFLKSSKQISVQHAESVGFIACAFTQPLMTMIPGIRMI